jgi:hypothetical protein
MPALESEKYFYAGILHHLVFVHSENGDETLYLNGEKVSEGFRTSGFSSWEEDYIYSVANNLDGTSPWHGELYFSAVYNRAFNEQDIIINYYASPFVNEDMTLNPDEIDFEINPNPYREGEAYIVFKDITGPIDITEPYFVNITNSNGTLVKQKVISEYLTQGEGSLDLSSLGAGIYFVSLYNQHTLISTKKMVILP